MNEIDKLKKRLCILSPCHWSGGIGGAELQIRLLLEKLVDSGRFDITYIASEVDENYRPKGYNVKKIESNSILRKAGLLFDTPMLFKALKAISPEIIYQRVGGVYTGVAAYYAKLNNCRMIWHVSSDTDVMPFSIDKRDSGPKAVRFIEKKFLEYGMAHSDVIIAQTYQQATMLESYYGLSETKVIPNYHMAPNVVEKVDDLITVVWVSNIKPMKRPEIFLRLASDLKFVPHVRFLMIGRGGESKWHRKVLQEIDAIGCIEYLGEIPNEEVNACLEQCHVLVNTSSFEGFPNTFIQAWLRSVPVVSLEVNPDDVLETQGVGYCSLSYERMRDQVFRLIENKKVRNKMGQRAKDYAEEKFSENNILEIMKELQC